MAKGGRPPGACNHRTTADALPCFVERKSIELLGQFGVMSEAEVRSRYEVKLEKYTKLLNIEARTMKRMVRRAFLPAINAYAAELAQGSGGHQGRLRRCGDHPAGEAAAHAASGRARDRRPAAKARYDAPCARDIADEQKKANYYAHEIIPVMDDLRGGRGRHGDPRGSRSLAGAHVQRPAVLRVADKAGAPGFCGLAGGGRFRCRSTVRDPEVSNPLTVALRSVRVEAGRCRKAPKTQRGKRADCA